MERGRIRDQDAIEFWIRRHSDSELDLHHDSPPLVIQGTGPHNEPVLLIFEQRVACPRQPLFAFHQDPGHLADLLRGLTGFRVLRHEGNIAPGSETWTEQMMLGFVPVVLGFRHTDLDPPHSFQERIIHGPFSRFVHRHEFEARGEETIVRDQLDVGVPLHFGGELAMRVLLGPWMRSFFALRHLALEELIAEGAMDSEALAR